MRTCQFASVCAAIVLMHSGDTTASAPHASSVGAFTIFDVPGAGNASPAGINCGGTITGTYSDAVGAHGFLRNAWGVFTTFDVPGAAYGTYPAAINAAGEITGTYYDKNPNIAHGFIRSSAGSFVTFRAPSAVARYGIFPAAISPDGEVTGFTFDANFIGHGFLTEKDGKVVVFEAPGAGTTGNRPGTYASGITGKGAILGNFGDASGFNHGYLLARDGTFTVFNAPGSMTSFSLYGYSQVLETNIAGTVAGTYFQSIAGNPLGGDYEGFVRKRDGTLTTFVAATSSYCCIFTYPDGINLEGAVTGFYNDPFNIDHGFIRRRNGKVIDFDAPGAGTGFDQGTVPLGINDAGVITGLIIDPSSTHHGFILTPNLTAGK